ncbi:TPA: hypothetical protein L1122_002837, partial [Enterobacter hormaechei]|nr:hypothetical protein [Enterobacter hormaechei]
VTDDAGSVTGSLSQNAVTDDTRPQISGTAKAGSTVTIMDGSNVLGTTTAGADGTWSFTPSVDLGRGEHTFTATAKDPMGNESASSSWTVTIDTDAPVKPTIDAALDDVGSVQGNLANGGSTDDPERQGGSGQYREDLRSERPAGRSDGEGRRHLELLTDGETAGR